MNSTTPLVDAAVNDTAFEDKNQPHTDWITAHAAREIEEKMNEAVAKGESITHQLGVAMMSLHESHAREAQLRAIVSELIPTARTMALQQKATQALAIPAPPVVPVEDVKPLIKALADVIDLAKFWGHDRYSNDLERAKISLSTFTAKHKI